MIRFVDQNLNQNDNAKSTTKERKLLKTKEVLAERHRILNEKIATRESSKSSMFPLQSGMLIISTQLMVRSFVFVLFVSFKSMPSFHSIPPG